MPITANAALGGVIEAARTLGRTLLPVTCAVAVMFALATPATAKLCQESEFAAAVDAAGAELRAYNASVSGQLSDRILKLKTAKGWPEDSYQELAADHLQDQRMAAFDAKANDLLTKVDTLGRSAEAGPADCEKLDELKAASRELLAVMQAKTAYTLAKLDGEISGQKTGVSDRPQPAAKAAPERSAEAKLKTAAPEPPAPVVTPQQPAAKPVTAAPAAKSEPKPLPPNAGGQVADWQSRTATTRAPEQAPQQGGPLALNTPAPGGPGVPYTPPSSLPPDAFETPEAGYTIEEIRDATRGFFGTISTNLATVIEHAFQSWGRPTAYVLGTEGGGAFLAGVRYGKGELYLRRGGRETIYWHGPSLGYDFGAEGSRTLFLIYRLGEPQELFRSFTGIDGSAYLLGGAGVTLLKGGPVIMAPIRTGLGLRLGANIGYIRFTPRATWNPF